MSDGSQGMSVLRTTIVDALNKSIEIFSAYREETFDEVMINGIRPFTDAVGLDRVVFYRLVDIEGSKRLGQIYRWDKSEGGLMSLAEELKVLPNHPVLEEWTNRSFTGEIIPYEVILTRTMYNGKYVVMGYQYDMRNTKRMMESIRKAIRELE